MRDLVLLAIVGALLPYCLFRPWIGVLVFTWLSMMNPHRLTYGFAYSWPWAFAVALVTVIGVVFSRDRRRMPWNAPLVLMVLCTIYFTMMTFFALAPEEYAWSAWERFVKIVLMTMIIPLVIYGQKRITWLVAVAALSIGFFGFKGGIFTLTHGGVFSVRGPAGSFIEDNNALGLALVMVVPLLHWLASQESRIVLKRIYSVTMWLSMLSSAFTYSRGALLGLASVTSLLFFKSQRKILVLLVAVPLIFFGMEFVPEQLYERAESIDNYQQDASAQLRLQAWGVAWNVAVERPLTGGGFAFEYVPDARWLSYAPFRVPNAANYARAAHSIYFQILGEQGFVGLALFLAMLFATLRSLRKTKLAAGKCGAPWIASLASSLQISLIAYMVSGAFLSLAYFDLPYLVIVLTAVLQREVAQYALQLDKRIRTANSVRPIPSSLPARSIQHSR